MTPTPKPGILDIAAYVGGHAPPPGAAEPYKLSSNESPFEPSPEALAAYERTGGSLHLYPDGGAQMLRDALGEAHGLNPERIVCGNGSGEILALLAEIFLRPGDEVLFSAHAFLLYRILTLANSAIPVVVPEKDLRVDVDAMLKAVSPRTRIVYLANPNNPTGSYLTSEEVRRFHAALPRSTLLVIDAAYAEYVRRNDYDSGIELVSQFDNVVMTRTFSKAYALAGLRVGWGFCPAAIVDVLNRVRGPFNVSLPAQAAAAAALRDKRYMEIAVEHNETWKSWLTEHIRKTGLRVDDSVGNFILIHFPVEGAHTVKAADAFLNARGLSLRGVANYGLPHCLRLTIGTEDANRRVATALAEFMQRERMTVDSRPVFGKVALIGIGLIGSSMAHAMRRGGLAAHIAGYAHRVETLEKARAVGFADTLHDTLEPAVRDADLVVLATPVGAFGPLAKEMSSFLKPGAILSDVGSVKTAVVRDVGPFVPDGVHLIPAHPVAGTEQSGPEAGFAELFDGRWCILTPPPGADVAAVEKLKMFWQRMGSQVEIMDPKHHDLVLAITSHVPHLIAYNIVGTAADLETVTESEVIKFSAGGFRDFTRIAASDPTMWRDVFLNNREAVLEMLGRFNEDLSLLQRAIRWGDGDMLFNLFTRTRAIRRSIIDVGQDSAEPNFGRPKKKN